MNVISLSNKLVKRNSNFSLIDHPVSSYFALKATKDGFGRVRNAKKAN